MDPSLLIADRFWSDDEPVFMGGIDGSVPRIDSLAGKVLFQTSGSSGTPKWVALSKSALMVSARAVNAHWRVDGHDCWGLILPIHHVGGFGVLARARQSACRLACFDGPWQARACAEWLASAGVTLTSMVPTQVHDLVAEAVPAPACLRAVVVGGGHLRPALGQAARDLGWPLLASYGMTEAGSQIATQGLECLANVYQAAPMPVLPHWEVGLCPDGRLRIAGEALFSGLLVRDGAGWSYREREGKWHETQDRVELDRGMLWPVGRADLQVKVLGELVGLEAIEGRIVECSAGSIPANALVVLALPDERAEHRLVPVLEATLDRAAVEAALAAYAAEAPGYARLAPPVFLESFPRSDLGKPLRQECLHSVRSQGNEAMPASSRQA